MPYLNGHKNYILFSVKNERYCIISNGSLIIKIFFRSEFIVSHANSSFCTSLQRDCLHLENDDRKIVFIYVYN